MYGQFATLTFESNYFTSFRLKLTLFNYRIFSAPIFNILPAVPRKKKKEIQQEGENKPEHFDSSQI